jgi:hypothetical protein
VTWAFLTRIVSPRSPARWRPRRKSPALYGGRQSPPAIAARSPHSHRNDSHVSEQGTMPIPRRGTDAVRSCHERSVTSDRPSFMPCGGTGHTTSTSARRGGLQRVDPSGLWERQPPPERIAHLEPGQANEDKQKKDLVHARDLGTRGDE